MREVATRHGWTATDIQVDTAFGLAITFPNNPHTRVTVWGASGPTHLLTVTGVKPPTTYEPLVTGLRRLVERSVNRFNTPDIAQA